MKDLASAPAWRREPYKLFFPLGLLLAWAGVLHWLLHGTGVLPDYRPVFHSIAQIQGFMTCFAVGFLFTAIPRRTGTAPPATWQMAAGLLLPVATTVAAWYERLALSQICWLALTVLLITFAARRFLSRSAGRRPPLSFIWVPISLAVGIAGSLMTSAPGILGPEYFWVHEIGKIFLLQGMFLGLVMGIGGMILPLITCGDAPADAGAARGDLLRLAGHLAAAAILVGSFWVERSVSLRAGFALRGFIILLVLLLVGRLWRTPRLPGWHRRLVWLSAWFIPLGYLAGAIWPVYSKAGLHVVFIGGFALMALSVGLHVTLAHGGYKHLVSGRPWQVPVYGGLLLAATVLRSLVDVDQARFFVWLAVSAAVFLLATLFWAALVIPHLLPRRRTHRPD